MSSPLYTCPISVAFFLSKTSLIFGWVLCCIRTIRKCQELPELSVKDAEMIKH